ncbi:MAG: 23S rRNA (adenine(2503)-C(2))-methyltransferase RlmN [Bacteriovoracaceae bacterium]|nr:23S rRNA (adenine(2503)-C(2))-methyltransferase RlmN [Bacteriovoracaceae bacterium]
MKKSFYEMSITELASDFAKEEINPKAASLLYRHFYKEKSTEACAHHNLSKKAKAYLSDHYSFDLPIINNVHISEDLTVKFLIEFNDGEKVESVLIPFQNKYTLCLSTQVGCAMKCSFCFTGTQGLKRQLSTSEIIGQFILAWNWLKINRPMESKTQQLKNIVFMGQGEPLHNFDAVKKACEILLDQHGASLGCQKITISTAGYLPGLKRWNEEMPGVNLALSLHSVVEEKRNELIPINKRFPLNEIMDYIRTIPLARKQYIIFEYLLIKDFNDSIEDAIACGEYLKDVQAIINLIPFNPFPGSLYQKPDAKTVLAFQQKITEYNIPALLRTTKGDDILAACGQLNTKINSLTSLNSSPAKRL